MVWFWNHWIEPAMALAGKSTWFHGFNHKDRRTHGFANKEVAPPRRSVVQIEMKP
jgi:hypothetical protein